MTPIKAEPILLPCPFCKKPPGTKVGPPAMARCITPGCEGTKLAADTFAEWNTRANGAARFTPIKAAAEPSREALEKDIERWKRDKGNTLEEYAAEQLLSRAMRLAAAPAGNAGVRQRFARELLHKGYHPTLGATKDALEAFETALEQPREALADEIKRADDAPPVASFDNASDMLGYLNAPREAGEPKPIGWCGWHPDHGFAWQTADYSQQHASSRLMRMDIAGNHGWSVQPFYASPSPIPEAPVGRDPATIEACAKLIEQQQETIRETSNGSERYVSPRRFANLAGMAYADAIRALKPQDGGNCEHGIAKVNCGICVPSKVFSRAKDGGESKS